MTDKEIERIASGFCARTLPREEWTHQAHFATALWLMLRRPDLVPERVMPGMITAYNESVGGLNSDMSGYHETITIASLKAARAVLAGLPKDVTPSEAFAALMTSPMAGKDWLLTYWSRDRLMSVEARRAWVEPDLKPLPWA